MAWIRVDDHYDEHPKLAAVGPLGQALWLAGLAYCNRNLTDGRIPWGKAQSLLSWEFLDPEVTEQGQKRMTIGVASGMSGDDVTCEYVIGLLLAAGLWEQIDSGGYYVHDYADYQLLKAEILAIRETKQAAGRAGGQASAQARAQAKSKPKPKPNPKEEDQPRT